jgi:hypothetical protein
MTQEMNYPDSHPNPKLQGQPKGIKAVLQECESVWDELMDRCNTKVVGKCKSYSKSQVKKDAEQYIVGAESMSQEEHVTEADLAQAEETVVVTADNWCCMYWVMSLQADFVNEKPLLEPTKAEG